MSQEVEGVGLRSGRIRTDSSDLQDDSARYKCSHCRKSFTRIENLTRHAAIHSGAGRFQCFTCQKRFSRSDLLNRHRKIHNNDPPNSAGVEFPSPNASLPGELASKGNLALTPQSLAREHPVHETNVGKHRESLLEQVWPERQAELPYGIDNSGFPNHVNGSGFPPNMGSTLSTSDPTRPSNAYEDLWGGFATAEGIDPFNMGSYDADIAWTFDFAQSGMMMDFSHAAIQTPSVGDLSEFSIHGEVNGQQNLTGADQDGPHGSGDSADGPEEEVRSGWPDRLSRPASPRPPRRQRGQLNSSIWNSTMQEVQRNSQALNYPAATVDAETRMAHLTALDLEGSGWTAERGVSEDCFPPCQVLAHFLRLYFQNVHSRFSYIHVPTFSSSKASPLLLLSMILTGSAYSKASRGRFSTLFYEPFRKALMKRHLYSHESFLRDFDNVFSVLLLCLAGTWSCNRHAYEFAEGTRGILVTACRRLRLLDCRSSAYSASNHSSSQKPTLEEKWTSWIATEKRKRLGLAIYMYDAQYPALFNNQPFLSKAETINGVFPCSREYWEAPTAEEWKMMIGPADIPPSIYYLHALNSCLLRKWVKPAPPVLKLDNCGRIVLIYSILIHVFEWRQAVSMCNPTSLNGWFKHSVHNIPEGLLDRQKWCVDALDSFYECYYSSEMTTAAALLHQFGYVLLYVSLSDLHLAAGRSGSAEDVDMAEQSLSYWANGKNAHGTMEHVLRMLNIAYEALEKGNDHDSSFEIAVCLFTGGLVCWVYNKLCDDKPTDQDFALQVQRARRALLGMGTWRICAMFGVTLKEFENTSNSRGPNVQ